MFTANKGDKQVNHTSIGNVTVLPWPKNLQKEMRDNADLNEIPMNKNL